MSGPRLVSQIFPSGLHDVAQVAAKTHDFAIQYLEQAPAVLAFVCYGHNARTASDMAYVARAFGSAVHRRPRLRDLLAAFGAPLPVRKIAGKACHPSYLSAIYDLRKIPPSVLSQAIPEKVGQQRAWLAALTKVQNRCRLAAVRQQLSDDLWRWAVPAMGSAVGDYSLVRRANSRQRTLADAAPDVMDLLFRSDTTLNPRWTFQQAEAAAQAWHDRLARQRTEQTMLQRLGFAFDYRFPYGSIPDVLDGEMFTFHALRSGEELFEEGQAMRHCVATYITNVAKGDTFIISIREAGRRVATLELGNSEAGRHQNRLVIRQMKGPCNAPVSWTVRCAAEQYVSDLQAMAHTARASIFQRMVPP